MSKDPPTHSVSLSVVPASLSDIPALATVAARTFPLACPPGTTKADIALFIEKYLSAQRFEAYLDDSARRILLLRHTTGDVVGYTMTVHGPVPDLDVTAALADADVDASAHATQDYLELSKCYTDTTVHGSGAAALLLGATLDDARASGHSAIWLGVNQLNKRAQAFYAKNGFNRVGVKHFYVGMMQHSDYVMAQRLS